MGQADKIEHLPSYAHNCKTGHFTSCRKDEKVFKMSKDEKCTRKNTVFHCQICKFVGFLLLSSSLLFKLPISEHEQGRRLQQREHHLHVVSFLDYSKPFGLLNESSLEIRKKKRIIKCSRGPHNFTTSHFTSWIRQEQL